MMRRLRETLLWAGAALGVLAVLAGVAVTFFGFSFLVFRSGSMSPTITTGALALSRTVQAADIRPGDVVSVLSITGDRVTHRVQLSTVRDGTASLVLKGDANLTPDEEIYQVTSAERVSVSLPYAGYVVAYALTPAGIVTAAAFCGMLIVIGFGDDDRPAPPARRDPRTPRAPRAPRRSRGDERRRRLLARTAGPAGGGTHRREGERGRPFRVAVAVVLVLGLGGGVVTAGRVTGTLARFTDSAGLSAGAFVSGTLVPPTGVACTPGTPNASITWTAPAQLAAASYRVTFTYTATLGGGSGTDIVTTTSWQPTGSLVSLLGRDYTVTVASLVSGTTWASPVSSPAVLIRARLLGGVLGAGLACT